MLQSAKKKSENEAQRPVQRRWGQTKSSMNEMKYKRKNIDKYRRKKNMKGEYFMKYEEYYIENRWLKQKSKILVKVTFVFIYFGNFIYKEKKDRFLSSLSN